MRRTLDALITIGLSRVDRHALGKHALELGLPLGDTLEVDAVVIDPGHESEFSPEVDYLWSKEPLGDRGWLGLRRGRRGALAFRLSPSDEKERQVFLRLGPHSLRASVLTDDSPIVTVEDGSETVAVYSTEVGTEWLPGWLADHHLARNSVELRRIR